MTFPILLVDDDHLDVKVLKRAFTDIGLDHPITVAHDGEQALDLLRGPDRPELIVLDLRMPRMDGATLLERLRETAELARIPAVVFTTSTAQRDRDRCFELGVSGYFEKPSNHSDYQRFAETLCRYWTQSIRA